MGIFKSKKVRVAIVAAAINIMAVVVGVLVAQPEISAVLVASTTAIGAALVHAIGQADLGKEAKKIEVSAQIGGGA